MPLWMKQGAFVDGDDNAFIRHQGIIDERPLARCFMVNGNKMWLPKSHIRDVNAEFVVVPKWLADAKKAASEF